MTRERRVLGLPVLQLTTKGRRTGKDHTVSLGYFESEGGPVITASNGGSPRHPDWFLNLRKDAGVRVRIGGESWRAVAEIARPESRARLWAQLIELAPSYASFQARTKRELPLIVLSRQTQDG